MSKTPARKRGRPKVGPETEPVTIAVPRADLDLADELVGPLTERSMGVSRGRTDVLRAAIARGLRSIRDELAK
jgi:hypothetical protein